MKIYQLLSLGVATLAVVAAGCSSVGPATEAASNAKFSHPRDITNPYLPLSSLKQDVLTSASERVERTPKPEVHKTFQINGQTVDALAVEDREFTASGDLTEVTLDYFAQDDDGNVYYLGEDVDDYKNGQVSGHGGGWLLGKDTQVPGIVMPAHPKAGDRFKSENVPGITTEDDEILALAENYSTPAGAFHNCVKIRENATGESAEVKYYAPTVGCIAELDSDGALLLKTHSTN